MTFNIQRLIDDCGGPAKLAEAIGVSRTSPYRWLKQDMLSSRVLVKIKGQYPELKIDDYIERGFDDPRNTERRTGISG